MLNEEYTLQALKPDVSDLLSLRSFGEPVTEKKILEAIHAKLASLELRPDLSGKQKLSAYLYALMDFVEGFQVAKRAFTLYFVSSDKDSDPVLTLKVGSSFYVMAEHQKNFSPWSSEKHGGSLLQACPDEMVLFMQANLPREEALVFNRENRVLGTININALSVSSAETRHLEVRADPDPEVRFYFVRNSANKTIGKDWKWLTTARYGEFDSSRASVVLATADKQLYKRGREVSVRQHLFETGLLRAPYWFRIGD